MNMKLYSYLTKEMINNSYVIESCFCPVCNAHMKKIKTSQPLECSGFNHLQTPHTRVHSMMDHSERLLKLNPYPILDTDPTLDRLNLSNTLYRSPHVISKLLFCHLLI